MLQSASLVRLVSRRINTVAVSSSILPTDTITHPQQQKPHLPLLSQRQTQTQTRSFASSGRNNRKKRSFQPRRRPHKQYRPFSPPKYEPKLVDKDLQIELGNAPDARDELERDFGHYTADLVKRMQRDQYLREQSGYEKFKLEEEEFLQGANYLTAEPGSTEALMYERKALEHMTDEEREAFEKEVDEIEKQAFKASVLDEMEVDDLLPMKPPKAKKGEEFKELFQTDEEYADFYGGDPQNPQETNFEPNRKAHGQWTDMVVDVRRGVHLWRGGRLETYRAMVVGGNLNGCAGFGVGRHKVPLKAIEKAARKARRNIYFVDRYQGNGLTSDLVGTQNNTRCIIRAVDNGLRGNPLMCEILTRFGITNAQCKAHGPRHLWNVVRGTFKAIATHESIEDVAMKRGRRILSLDKALRLKG